MAEGDCRKIDSRGTSEMAKTTPMEFLRQVRAEAGKVVWPTWPETSRTAIFVAIMMMLLAVFFLGIDSVFGAAVAWLIDQV
jgi:preprotein translocase subunit SecE